jgi:hypothetical protein
MAVVLLACGLMSAQDDGAPAGSIRGYDKNAASWLQEQEFAGNAPDAQVIWNPTLSRLSLAKEIGTAPMRRAALRTRPGAKQRR